MMIALSVVFFLACCAGSFALGASSRLWQHAALQPAPERAHPNDTNAIGIDRDVMLRVAFTSSDGRSIVKTGGGGGSGCVGLECLDPKRSSLSYVFFDGSLVTVDVDFFRSEEVYLDYVEREQRLRQACLVALPGGSSGNGSVMR